MVNDLSTLNGSLVEMKDQLIYELGEKGVTASYDSTTGLLGLIGKISEIQQGGSCYHIELNESAYTTTGSLTVTATLQNQYQPYANQIVTFTGGTSTVTATTDSNGVATATVTFSASGTLTASYSNVSDTATVTVQTYLFYDDCSSASGLTNYGSSVQFERTPTSTITYNNGEYLISGSSCCFAGHEILPLHGVDNAKLRVKFKLNTTSQAAYNQFCIFCTDKTVSNNPPYEYGGRVRNDRLLQYFSIVTESTIYTHSVAYSTAWFYLEVVKNGTSWTITLYDSSLNRLATNTRSLSSMTNPNWYLALLTEKGTNYSVHIKEIIAEPI